MNDYDRIGMWLVLAVAFVFAAVICLAGCGPLDSWNPPKAGYFDTITGCPRYMHNVRGPDAWDREHGQPYHCEKPAWDPDNGDIDPGLE